MKNSLLILIWFILAVITLKLSVVCQITEENQSRISDFGKSLKPGFNQNEKINNKTTAKNDSDEVINVQTNLVLNDIMVLDKAGKTINGLKVEDFIVEEDSNPQKIEVFSLGDKSNISRSIVLIIDNSITLFGYTQTSIDAAKTLVDKLNPNDRLAIVTANVELLVDFTNDKKLLKSKLDSLDGQIFQKSLMNNGRQYSALYATLNELFDERDIRPIIIFQTDGYELPVLKESNFFAQYYDLLVRIQQRHFTKEQLNRLLNERTNFTFNDLITATEKTRATLYTVIPGYRVIGVSEKEQINAIKETQKWFNLGYAEYCKRNNLPTSKFSSTLITDPVQILKQNESVLGMARLASNLQLTMAELAKFTGGWTDFLETPEQADAIYSRILTNINNRYLIGYYPTNQERDGKSRNVNIKVKGHPEYIVWGRKTYLPS